MFSRTISDQPFAFDSGKHDLQIDTNRSKLFPATWLVGLSVKAVALAFATAAVPVEVYCVCANVVAA